MFRLEISAKKQGNSINVGMSYKSGQSVLSSLHGAYAKMKGNTPTGLRIKELCLVLIVFASTSIFLWAWEKTPLFTLWIPPQRHVVVLSSEMFINKSGNGTLSHSQKPGDVGDSSQTTRETNHTFVSNNLLTASNIHNPLQFSEKYKSWSPLAIKEECNYAKGKWFADSKRPLYSGFGCKQWLSEMWACRLTQRTDFSYESFRWQPDDCNMPEFDGAAVLKRMQNKTIALIGDSLGRQQFQSLMCMVTGGKNNPEVVDVGIQYGLIKAPGALRPDGWAYWFPHTNTTILYYWSATLCELEPLNITDPATQYAMHLDRPVTFLQQNLHRFDVLVLNTGHHWNRGKLRSNRWIMYVEGSPNTNRRLREIGNAKKFTIYSVVKWLDSQLPHHPKLKAFFRTTSPRHFFNGDWNSGGICDNTIPLARRNNFSQDNFHDPIAESAVKSTKVKLLDITGLSQLRDEAHISRYSVKATVGVQDCLHWCLPGIPDSWNEILVAQI